MPQRNADAKEKMQAMTDCMTEELYDLWVIERHGERSLSPRDYASFIFHSSGHHPRICTFERNVQQEHDREFDFKALNKAMQTFTNNIPHIQIAGEPTMRSGVFVVFADTPTFETLYDQVFGEIILKSGLDPDRIESGMGEEMPYQVTISIINPHLSDEDTWYDILPLCNDYFFGTKEFTMDQVTMYFRDQVDFVEASLVANAT